LAAEVNSWAHHRRIAMIQIPADWALNLWRGQVALNNDSLRSS
jgi:hypothetical protein